MSESVPAFYTHENNAYVTTGLGISPWNDQAQMGVALAGLAAHCIEQVPNPGGMLTTRLTIDIMGTVPTVPLTPVSRVLRDGRQMQLVETDLTADGRIWVHTTALRLRTADTPQRTLPPTRSFPPEGRDPNVPRKNNWVETILLEGGFEKSGPGAQWVRLTSTVVKDEPLRPLEALAMLADFGSGTAPLLPVTEWTQANVDISLHIARLPEDDWILVDAISEGAGNGIGVVHSRLSDRQGSLGMAHQTLFLNQR